MLPLTPRPTLFPYTTLFRSRDCKANAGVHAADQRVDADDFAVNVHQRPAAVPRIDERIRLDEILVYEARSGLLDNVRAAFGDRKSTRLNSSHTVISYAVFCL